MRAGGALPKLSLTLSRQEPWQDSEQRVTETG